MATQQPQQSGGGTGREKREKKSEVDAAPQWDPKQVM